MVGWSILVWEFKKWCEFFCGVMPHLFQPKSTYPHPIQIQHKKASPKNLARLIILPMSLCMYLVCTVLCLTLTLVVIFAIIYPCLCPYLVCCHVCVYCMLYSLHAYPVHLCYCACTTLACYPYIIHTCITHHIHQLYYSVVITALIIQLIK